mmetsp:Transcript_52114/g.166943  ORF Transcript_52114/g.166943 Transcript_52114/m.166943 type:complete len:328 (-) Transcript_52114:8-991(-)
MATARTGATALRSAEGQWVRAACALADPTHKQSGRSLALAALRPAASTLVTPRTWVAQASAAVAFMAGSLTCVHAAIEGLAASVGASKELLAAGPLLRLRSTVAALQRCDCTRWTLAGVAPDGAGVAPTAQELAADPAARPARRVPAPHACSLLAAAVTAPWLAHGCATGARPRVAELRASVRAAAMLTADFAATVRHPMRVGLGLPELAAEAGILRHCTDVLIATAGTRPRQLDVLHPVGLLNPEVNALEVEGGPALAAGPDLGATRNPAKANHAIVGPLVELLGKGLVHRARRAACPAAGAAVAAGTTAAAAAAAAAPGNQPGTA